MRGMASYSTRENRGGVLLWNVPNVAFGLPSKEVRLEVVMKNMPVAVFDLEAYIIDDKKQPERGFNYRPAAVFAAQQTDANGSYVFPPEEYSGLKLPVNGTVYLNIVPIKPSALPTSPIDTLPETRILRLHHYFGKRPARSTMYAYMDQRTWSAHLGMGDESTGFAIAGATVKFIPEDPEILTVSLDMVEGGLSSSGMYGVRVDMPSSQSNTSIGSYQPEDSYFFYQEGRQPCAVPQAAAEEEAGRVGMYELDLSAGSTVAKAPEEHVEEGNKTGSYLYASNTVLSVNGRRLQLDASPQDACRLGGSNGRLIQVPNLWGSKHPVPGRNFLPVNLSSFTFDALGFAPPGWDGRATFLFVLKDGIPHTKVSARVTAL